MASFVTALVVARAGLVVSVSRPRVEAPRPVSTEPRRLAEQP
ncbi:hypothetical protein [Mobilicoccus massiliensis]|nr:hypothetical protein [Mobilicoccus massiliensis]